MMNFNSIPIFFLLLQSQATRTFASNQSAAPASQYKSFDNRKTITREQAKSVYNKFALSGHIAGRDASSGYGGPAVRSLMALADFGVWCDPTSSSNMEEDEQPDEHADTTTRKDNDANVQESSRGIQRVFDYGCGQGKLAERVFHAISSSPQQHSNIHWHGVDQSPEMIAKFQQRLEPCNHKSNFHFSSELMKDGNPNQLLNTTPAKYYHRFVSTYCLDLLSEEDMHSVLSLAEHCLHPNGKLILAGITYGYKDSFKTFWMTLAWEIMYRIRPDVVGGCRPQRLRPYLEEMGWRVEDEIRTLPVGFPWMVSEVICATRGRSISEEVD